MLRSLWVTLLRLRSRRPTRYLRIFGMLLSSICYILWLVSLSPVPDVCAQDSTLPACPETLPSINDVSLSYLSKCSHCVSGLSTRTALFPTPTSLFPSACSVSGDKIYTGHKDSESGATLIIDDYYKISSGSVKYSFATTSESSAVATITGVDCYGTDSDFNQTVNVNVSGSGLYVFSVGVSGICRVTGAVAWLDVGTSGDVSLTVQDGREYTCGSPTPTNAPTPTNTPNQYFAVPYSNQNIVVPTEPHWPSSAQYYYNAPTCPNGASLKGVFANFTSIGNDTAFRILWNGGGDMTAYCPSDQNCGNQVADYGYLWDLTGGQDMDMENYLESLDGVGSIEVHWAYNESYWHNKIGLLSWGTTAIQINDFYTICYGTPPVTVTPTPTSSPSICQSFENCYDSSNPNCMFKTTGTYQVAGINLPYISTSTVCYDVVPQITFAVGGNGVNVPNIRVCNHPVIIGQIEILGIVIPSSLLIIGVLAGLIALVLSI